LYNASPLNHEASLNRSHMACV